MAQTTVSEAVARPLRTAPQGGAAWAIAEVIDAFVYDLSDRQYGALIVALTMLFSFIQTAAENGIGKAFLRSIPPTDVPISDSDPEVNADEPGTLDDQELGIPGDAEPLPEDDIHRVEATQINDEE